VKSQSNVSSQICHHNNSTNESKDNELTESSEKEIRSSLLKIISDFKEDSNKQIMKLGEPSKTEKRKTAT
jgi:hypothetical protein